MCCVAGWSFPWTVVTQCTAQLVECLKVKSCIDGFRLWQNLTSMHPVAFQKTVPILHAAGIVLASFSWVMLCDAITCSVILFLDHSDGTSFYHPSTCCRVITFNSILFQQLWGNILHLSLCSFFSRRGTQCAHAFWYQTCSYLLDNMLSYSNLCCHFPVTSWFSLMSSSSSPPLSVEAVCR